MTSGGKARVLEYYGDCNGCHSDPERQAVYRCAFLSEKHWQPAGGMHLAVWMGRQGTQAEPWPTEGHEDGCPGSWYRCEWYRSVMRYRGPHGRVATDRLVLDALEYFEDQEARAREHRT